MDHTNRSSTHQPPTLEGLSAQMARQRCAAYAQACALNAIERAQANTTQRQRALRAKLPWQQRWTHPEHRRVWMVLSALFSVAIYVGLAWWMSTGLAWQRGNLAWVVVLVLALLPLAMWVWALRPSMAADQQDRHRSALRRYGQQAREQNAEMRRIEAVYQLQPYIEGDYGQPLATQAFATLLGLWRDLIVEPSISADTTDPAADGGPTPLQRSSRSALARAIATLAHGEAGEHWLTHARSLPTIGVKASGWNAHQANWSGLNWAQASLTAANLSQAQLAGVHWPQAQLASADLSYADLHHADVTGAVLNNARLSRAQLSAATLRHAQLRGADASNTQCVACDLRDIQASASVWTHSNLSNARLTHARLEVADLNHTRLTHANLRGAHLRGAHMQHANLAGACCVDTVIDEHTELQGAHFDARTQFGRTDNNGNVVDVEQERERWKSRGAVEVDGSAENWAQVA